MATKFICQPSAPPTFGARLREAAIRFCDLLVDARERADQRRRLIELSDAHLSDIGISRAEAWAEYRKPWWRA